MDIFDFIILFFLLKIITGYGYYYYNYNKLVTKYLNKTISATVEKNLCMIEKFRTIGRDRGRISPRCILSLVYTIDGLEYKKTIHVDIKYNKIKEGDILNIRYNNNDKNDIILDSNIKQTESYLYYFGIIIFLFFVLYIIYIIYKIYKIYNTKINKPKTIKTSNTISNKVIK